MRKITNETTEETIDKIIGFSEKEKLIYNKLSLLENYNKKETKEYYDYIKYLNMILEMEEDEYNNLIFNSSTCAHIFHYLLKNKKIELSFNNIESIVQRDNDCLIYRRLINKMSNKSMSFIDEETLPNYFQQLFLQFTDAINSPQLTIMSFDLRKLLLKDLYMGYIFYLQENIDKEKNEKLKEKLIQSKYDTSFILSDIEENLLINNFDVSKEHVLSSEASLTEIYSMNRKIYSIGRLKNVNPIVMSQILGLININNDLYSVLEYKTQSLLRSSMLKSALSFYSKEELISFESDFKEGIKSSNCALFSTSINTIENAISEIKNTNKVFKLKIKV